MANKSQTIKQNPNTKSRSKNFTEAESSALLSACDKFYNIINKNSNRDCDKKAKNNAWLRIKSGFDQYCKSEGVYVSKNSLFFCVESFSVQFMRY